MTRKETIKELETIKMCKVDTVKQVQALDLALAALRAPTREQVERMRGKWTDVYMSSPSSFTGACSVCRTANDIPPPVQAHFCPTCGAPMTDEAVDMILKRMEEMMNEH